jgi:hypothetical protein
VRREACHARLVPLPPSDGLALALVLAPKTGPYQKGETVTASHYGETRIMRGQSGLDGKILILAAANDTPGLPQFLCKLLANGCQVIDC